MAAAFCGAVEMLGKSSAVVGLAVVLWSMAIVETMAVAARDRVAFGRGPLRVATIPVCAKHSRLVYSGCRICAAVGAELNFADTGTRLTRARSHFSIAVFVKAPTADFL